MQGHWRGWTVFLRKQFGQVEGVQVKVGQHSGLQANSLCLLILSSTVFSSSVLASSSLMLPAEDTLEKSASRERSEGLKVATQGQLRGSDLLSW